MCGEHIGLTRPPLAPAGSSPRVRGTPCVHRLRLTRTRFIPACAGNTTTHPRLRRSEPVHPRVCGEHCTVPLDPRDSDGSSPRVRGTPARTPAPCSAPAVHPRVCGEHRARTRVSVLLLGSSPRVRGTPETAGTGRARPAVHPRVCGEHGVDLDELRITYGSSPRVRGTHLTLSV